jgi:hypothetical protein
LSLSLSCKMVSTLKVVGLGADVSGDKPFCTNIDDTDKDDPDGYGSFKIPQVRPLKDLG